MADPSAGRQTVLVTGANRGIGRYLASGLAQAGHDVALLGRSVDGLNEVASERGPMLVTHAVLPGMLSRGSGRIINLNSGAGYDARLTYTGYAMSKGALARFTTLLDAQYRERGIRVFDLSPGVVRTDMTSSMPMHDDRTAWTRPEEVIALAAAIANGSLDELSGRGLTT